MAHMRVLEGGSSAVAPVMFSPNPANNRAMLLDRQTHYTHDSYARHLARWSKNMLTNHFRTLLYCYIGDPSSLRSFILSVTIFGFSGPFRKILFRLTQMGQAPHLPCSRRPLG